MRLPTVTPYKHLHELEDLERGFLDACDGENTDVVPSDLWRRRPSSRRSQQQEAALVQVQLLLNRGSCPFAIEATASLCSAVMGDSAAVVDSSSAASARAHDLAKLAYSMALVRFVNGVVDEYQSGLFAESIASLAARAHLPIWLVEIRHAATHQKIPSLPVLREGCAAALAWLRNYYWRRLAGSIRAPEGHVLSESPHDLGSAGADANLLTGSELVEVINEAEERLGTLSRRLKDKSLSFTEADNAEGPPFKEIDGRVNLPNGWTRNFSHKMRPLGWTSTTSLST